MHTSDTTTHQPDTNPFPTVFDWRLLGSDRLFAPIDHWREWLQDPDFLAAYYAPAKCEEKRSILTRMLKRFGRHFDQPEVAILRIPGRVHTVGVHVDRPGCRGPVNRLAVEREMLMVIGLRNDAHVVIKAQGEFPEFSGELDLADWYRQFPKISGDFTALSGETDSWDQVAGRIEAQARYERDGKLIPKSPVTFLSGAAFLLNDYFARVTDDGTPEAVLSRGFNVVMYSDVPVAAGCASSSATTIGFAMALCLSNRCRIVARAPDPEQREIEFLHWLRRVGFSEWCAGTRGAEADHATIIFGKAGGISHIGPEGLRAVLELPNCCTYLLMNTPQRPKISDAYSKQRIESYLLGRAWLRAAGRKRGDATLAKLANLAAVVEVLKLGDAQILELMLDVPDRVTRAGVYGLVAAGALDRAEIEGIIGRANALSGYEREVAPSERDCWNPRRTALEQIADVKRSVRNREILADPSMTEQEKRRAIFRMARAYQESMRVTDYGDDRAVWNQGVDDADLKAAIAALRDCRGDPTCTLENLTRAASYGMNSREIDDLTRHLCQAVGDRVDDIAVLTLGMGGGGSVLAMAADELREPLREAYREFAEARGYLNSASRLGLCIDVQPARGAEALVPPSAGA